MGGASDARDVCHRPAASAPGARDGRSNTADLIVELRLPGNAMLFQSTLVYLVA